MNATRMQQRYNLRCPECDALQPVFGLSLTYEVHRPLRWSTIRNEFAVCANCAARLKLVPKLTFGTHAVVWLGIVAANIFGFIAVVVLTAMALANVMGLWIVCVLMLLALGWAVFQYRILNPLYFKFLRKVVVT